MTQPISEFKGDAGVLYLERDKDDRENPYNVWFEDFFILGQGASKTEALNKAVDHAIKIAALANKAREESEQ